MGEGRITEINPSLSHPYTLDAQIVEHMVYTLNMTARVQIIEKLCKAGVKVLNLIDGADMLAYLNAVTLE